MQTNNFADGVLPITAGPVLERDGVRRCRVLIAVAGSASTSDAEAMLRRTAPEAGDMRLASVKFLDQVEGKGTRFFRAEYASGSPVAAAGNLAGSFGCGAVLNPCPTEIGLHTAGQFQAVATVLTKRRELPVSTSDGHRTLTEFWSFASGVVDDAQALARVLPRLKPDRDGLPRRTVRQIHRESGARITRTYQVQFSTKPVEVPATGD
jgi:hypothetical protein